MTMGKRLSGVSEVFPASACRLPTPAMHEQSARESAAAINKALKEEKNGK